MSRPKKTLSDNDVFKILKSIEDGTRRVFISRELMLERLSGVIDCGDFLFVTEDGWKMSVFIDCGEWDYLNWMESPKGARRDGIPSAAGSPLHHYRPSSGKNWGIE